MKKNISTILLVVIALATVASAELMDPNIPGVAKGPVVYMPFENTDSTYGPGTGSNPAWLNQVTGESPIIVDRGVMYWPLINVRDGVKGDYFDGTSMNAGTSYTDILTFNDVEGSTVMSISELKSCTYTFWVRTGSDAVKGTNTYVLRGPFQVYFGADGRMGTHYWPNLSWNAPDLDDYMSYGEWLFVAIVIDQNGIKYYRGDVGNAPILVSETVASTGTSVTNPSLYIGWNTYVGAKYMNYDLDEVRIWGDKTDNSGALSLTDIETIWAYDYDPSSYCGDLAHPVPVADLTGDCFVSIADFAIFANNWLIDNRPEE